MDHVWGVTPEPLQDFARRVGPDASTKAKDGWVWKRNIVEVSIIPICCLSGSGKQTLENTISLYQKLAQLDEEAQMQLHDNCCLWHYLRPKLESAFPKGVVQKHYEMFMRGILIQNLVW